VKAVFSHWSVPRKVTPQYRVMAALAVSYAAQHYEEVVLTTDEAGEKMFAPLRLPFTEVNIELEGFKAPREAWAAGKLHTYYLQTKPFIHLDFDVFLGKQWKPERFNSVRYLVQSTESHERYIHSLSLVPDVWLDELSLSPAMFYAYNMGVFGGTQVDRIAEYAERALYAIRNSGEFHPYTMPVFEQAFFARFAQDRGLDVTEVLPGPDLEAQAEELGYMHLMAAKEGCPECMSKVRRRLQDLDPDLLLRAELGAAYG